MLRVRQLYEISALLTRFDDDALPRVAALLAEALPLRSVIIVLESRSGEPRREILWPAQLGDGRPGGAASASTRAEACYAYLVGTASTPPKGAAEDAPNDLNFLTLPLVVDRAPTFGVLQLETVCPCDEQDLLFANSAANQLAIALDRQRAIEARQKAAEDEKNRAETRRAEAVAMRRRYEALIDHLDHTFVWEADAETRQVIYVSARAEALLGYPRERWLDEPDFWMACVHAEDRGMLQGAFEKAAATGKDQRCDNRCITADGRSIWLHTGMHLARDDPETPTLQGVSTDVTPAKDAEAGKQEQLDFSRAMTGSLGEGVIAVDLEGRVTFVNPAAERLLALPMQKMLGAAIRTVFRLRHAAGAPLSEHEYPAIVAMRTGTASRSEDFTIARRHGDEMPVSCTASPLWRGKLISGAVIVIQDITERKRIEESQREADRRKDEFIAMLGHELRNPLAPIASAAQVLRSGDAASQRRAGEIIERQADRMGRLIDELLDVARIATGRVELDRRPVDLRTIVANSVEMVRPIIDRHRHHVDLTLPEEPLWLHADDLRLEQVAANLLGNAAKYTSPGGRLAVIAEREGADAILRVQDNGPGIAAALLPRIFELFTQGERRADRAEGGLGIGLALVKRIVELHGGTVEAQTVQGEGSEFTVRLPLAISAIDSSSVRYAGGPEAHPARLRILVVDDSVDTAESLAMLLRTLHHEVRTAHDGGAAIRTAVDFLPDAIFLDIGLPGMDGYEVAKRLRRDPRLLESTLIALTGYGQDADQKRSREAGFDHHLTKPTGLGDLDRILQGVRASSAQGADAIDGWCIDG